MNAFNVAELMNDPDFARGFTIRRPRPTVVDATGIATTPYETLLARGIVQPTDPKSIQMLPEGTRLDNLLSVFSKEELRVGDGKTRESDVIVVDGQSYRAIRCDPWGDKGYFEVTCEGFVTS